MTGCVRTRTPVLARGHGALDPDAGAGTGVGGFAEAGASYFVTPRLTLSGTYGINLQYTSGNTRQVVGIVNGQQITGSTSGWVAQTTGVRLTGAIFF